MKIADARDFVQLHPSPDYWTPELCFISVPIHGTKHEQLHLIDEEIAMRYLPAKKIKRYGLALATKPNDVFFLCIVPTQNLDVSWNETARKACEMAKALWVQALSRKAAGIEDYEIVKAYDPDAFPEPKWLLRSMDELIQITFHGSIIETDDHPAIRRLLGKRQDLS
jgi:hypothetical protein